MFFNLMSTKMATKGCDWLIYFSNFFSATVDGISPMLTKGACRVELCSNLMEGGTTPSIGMLKIVKQSCGLPVFVMIRPRGGDFLFSDIEMKVMKEDILALKAAGANGFVIGILTSDGHVDEKRCQELIDLIRPLPLTFHRAVDVSRDPLESLDILVQLGFDRVLTSGGSSSALEGLPVLHEMVERAKERIIVMPGGGINEGNLERILLGCGATEFHASARISLDSSMMYRKGGVPMGASISLPEFSIKVTDYAKVMKLGEIQRNFLDNLDKS